MGRPRQQQLVQRYELLDEVGHGGMAVVFRGKDTTLNREVAVKILHDHLAEEEESRQRFHREAHAVAQLKHRNIIEIYDYSGIDSEQSYIVTEFIHGSTLRAFLQSHPISHPEIAAMIIVEVCGALAHAHSMGIIHRDIKPENIMIREDGLVKLTDFGIAQVVDIQRMTVTGQLLGSPAYMAPELVEGKPIDYRSDVFSVGTLLYQLATSELPFKGDNPHQLLKRISEGQFLDPEVANPVVGGGLGRIIRKALAHDPDARYLDIVSLREDLLDFLQDAELHEPRRELGAYFPEPKKYSQELQERVVEALSQKGRQAMRRRQVPRALDLFNRVLCVDPTNKDVLATLDGLHRRQRRLRIISVLVLILLLLTGGYMANRAWPELAQGLLAASDTGGETAGTEGVTGDAAPLRPDVAARVRDAALDTLPWPDQRRPDQQKKEPRPPAKMPSAPPQVVELRPIPQRVSIWLDKQKLGDFGPDLRAVAIPGRGNHELVLRNEACFDRVIRIKQGQRLVSPMQVKLRWKPAQLVVITRPVPDANVVVGGNVYRAGEPIPIQIPDYSNNGRAEIRFKVSADGYYTVEKRVEVIANTPRRVELPLRALQ